MFTKITLNNQARINGYASISKRPSIACFSIYRVFVGVNPANMGNMPMSKFDQMLSGGIGPLYVIDIQAIVFDASNVAPDDNYGQVFCNLSQSLFRNIAA